MFDLLPNSLLSHAGYLLVVLGKRAQRLFSAEVEKLGLRPPHCDILFLLQERGPLAQVEVANVLQIERAHLVALLDQMAARQLIIRAAHPNDRRKHALELTEAGQAVAQQLGAIALAVEAELLRPLPAADHATFRTSLQILARAEAASGAPAADGDAG